MTKHSPRVYVRPGFHTGHKQSFDHLHQKMNKLAEVARKHRAANLSVTYATPEQLGKSVEWMMRFAEKFFQGEFDWSVYTDTNAKGKPRMWVQLIHDNHSNG